MKKFLAVALSAALVAGLAAGCGSDSNDAGSGAKTAKVIDVDLTSEEYAFGVDKTQPELLDEVNAFIQKIKDDEEHVARLAIQQLYTTYRSVINFLYA